MTTFKEVLFLTYFSEISVIATLVDIVVMFFNNYTISVLNSLLGYQKR